MGPFAGMTREPPPPSPSDASSAEHALTEGSTPEPKGKRRGRPPGSKNLAQRKDAGIKKTVGAPPAAAPRAPGASGGDPFGALK